MKSNDLQKTNSSNDYLREKTTTISTIVVNAKPHTIIVLGLLKNLNFTQIRIDEMKPKLLEIGNDFASTNQLFCIHADLCNRLQSKQSQINVLLAKANLLATEQSNKNDVIVYKAMAESLNEAWKDLSRELDLRGYILQDTLHFYEMAKQHEILAEKSKAILQLKNHQLTNTEIAKTQQHIDELIDLTAKSVDLGLNIIVHIRILGSLADNENRSKEVVDACLNIEKVMLRLAETWENISCIWNEQRNNFNQKNLQNVLSNNKTNVANQNFVDFINTENRWLNESYKTFNKLIASETTNSCNKELLNQHLETMLGQLKNHQDSLKRLQVTEEIKVENKNSYNTLLNNLNDFEINLKKNLVFSICVKQFEEKADSMLNQLKQMNEELLNATASMASELGPLAHQKTNTLIDEGNNLLQNNNYLHKSASDLTKLSEKISSLQKQVFNVEELARAQIVKAKTLNAKFEIQLSDLNNWLKNEPEKFLENYSNFGIHYNSCVEFISQHKQLAANISVHEPELIAMLNNAPKMPHANRKVLADLQQRFQLVQKKVENRIELAQNFINVLKFDSEINNLTSVLCNLYESNLSEKNNIQKRDLDQQVRDTIQSIKEKFQQEKHNAEKFIHNAKIIAVEDTFLKISEAEQLVRKLILAQEKRLLDVEKTCNNLQQTQNLIPTYFKPLEEVNVWQLETCQLINFIENHLHESDSKQCNIFLQQIIEAIEQFPSIKQKLLSVQKFADQIPIITNNCFALYMNKQNNIEHQLFKLLKKLKQIVSNQKQIITTETTSSLITQIKNVPYEEKNENSLNIIKKSGEKPFFVDELTNVNAIEGSTATLQCVIVGVPEPNVIWYKEEKCIQESDRIKLKFLGDNCSLTINPVQVNDTGLYKVKAINAYGETANFCRLNVTSVCSNQKMLPSTFLQTPIANSKNLSSCNTNAPVIEMPLINQTVIEDQTAVFQIFVKSDQPYKVRWYFKNQEIPLDDTHKFQIKNNVPSTGFYQLIINKVSLEVSGLYLVEVNNLLGKVQSKAILNVNPSPYITVSNYYQENNLHNVLPHYESANVLASNNKNLQMMYNDQHYLKNPNAPSKQHLNQLTEADAFLKDYVPKNFNDIEYNIIAKAPEFIRPFQSEYTFYENDKVQIDCIMIGNPKPKISWFFNNRPIQSNCNFVEFKNIGDTYFIKFASAQLEHAGYYQMIAENIRGKTESLTLIHICPQRINKFRKTQSLEPHQLMKDLRSFPMCNSLSPLKEFSKNISASSILKNQQVPCTTQMSTSVYYSQNPSLTNYKKHPVHTKNFSTSYTTHFSVSPDNSYQSDEYYPEKKNSFDKQQNYNFYEDANKNNNYFSSCYLNKTKNDTDVTNNIIAVKTEGNSPHFCQTLISCVVNIGDSAKFEAIVTGSPEPEICWSKDDKLIQNSKQILKKGEHVSLSIENTQLEDSGKYVCTARNKFGIATSSSQLIVRPKAVAPDFTKRLISKELMEGERLIWTIKIMGDPIPKVTWLRNSQIISNCNEVRLTQESIDEFSMIIERVETADSGQFTCLLENDAGEARSTADLIVRSQNSQPGNYFHVTRIKNDEVVKNEAINVEPLQTDL